MSSKRNHKLKTPGNLRFFGRMAAITIAILLNAASLQAEEITVCEACTSASDYQQRAIWHAYGLAQQLSPGIYYPWVNVVNFNNGTIYRFEVELDVNSSESGSDLYIPDATAKIIGELSVPTSLQADVDNSAKIAQSLHEIGFIYPGIYYYFEGEDVFDFLGDQNAYNDMEVAYRSQLANAAGWARYGDLWSFAFASEFVSWLSPFEFIGRVEFRDGSFIDFVLKPQFVANGEAFAFEFEFKKAFDADGNEVFEDPDIYLNENFITDLGEWQGAAPSADQMPLTAYLQSIGYEVEVHDGRGSFGCVTVARTYCYSGPDTPRQCDTEVVCQ